MQRTDIRVIGVVAGVLAFPLGSAAAADSDAAKAIAEAATFYASFDRDTTADYGSGDREIWTRYDHPSEKGKNVSERGCDRKLVELTKATAVRGGSLHFKDVLPRNGFLFFRAGDKLAIKPKEWGGTASVWIKTDPEKMLKTKHCDPIHLVEKRYFDGAIWCDFTDDKPRDLRLGFFPSLAPGQGEPKVPESEQPMVRAADPPFAPDAWHHVALTWRNVNSSKPDAQAIMYLDGRPIAALKNRDVQINWDRDRVRFYVGSALVGWLDEASLFSRPLSDAEMLYLYRHPDVLAQVRGATSRAKPLRDAGDP